MSKQWSKQWKSSTKPGKQRKYQENAPYHQRKQFLNARLADDVQDKMGTNTISIREGDTVKIERGDHAGTRGDVREVDYEEQVIYIDGLNRETVSGSETTIPIRPSNVVIERLNLDDEERIAKFDITEAEKDEIRAEGDVEAEEADEETEDEEVEEETDEEESADSDDVDYAALVEENVDDVKDRVRDDDSIDVEQVLEAEQDNKNRKTLVEWLENRMNGDNQ